MLARVLVVSGGCQNHSLRMAANRLYDSGATSSMTGTSDRDQLCVFCFFFKVVWRLCSCVCVKWGVLLEEKGHGGAILVLLW